MDISVKKVSMTALIKITTMLSWTPSWTKCPWGLLFYESINLSRTFRRTKCPLKEIDWWIIKTAWSIAWTECPCKKNQMKLLLLEQEFGYFDQI